MTHCPYEYKTVYEEGRKLFSSDQSSAQNIQNAIEQHTRDGWELFQFSPLPNLNGNILIFRRPVQG